MYVSTYVDNKYSNQSSQEWGGEGTKIKWDGAGCNKREGISTQRSQIHTIIITISIIIRGKGIKKERGQKQKMRGKKIGHLCLSASKLLATVKQLARG